MTRREFMAAVLVRLAGIMRALVAKGKGWHDLSEWWWTTLRELAMADVWQLVARVGRRGGKSSTACAFAVAFAFVYAALGLVPPGDTGWCVFVSVRREEAMARLSTIERMLLALGVRFESAGDGAIVLVGTNIGFRVLSASVEAVSGWTSILIIADEVAKWRDLVTGSNPAQEVLAALRPTMATQPLAMMFLISSPLGTIDAHAQSFDEGAVAGYQIVAYAPSWVANPSVVTKEGSRLLERDERKWRREYEAIPQSGALGAFDPDAVDSCFTERRLPEHVVPATPTIIIDASSGRADAWTWASVRWLVPRHRTHRMERRHSALAGDYWDFVRDARGEPIKLTEHELFAPTLRVDWCKGVEGSFWNQVSADKIVDAIAKDCANTGSRRVVGDQREAYALGALFAARKLAFSSLPWSQPSKVSAVETVRALMRDGRLQLPRERIGGPTSQQTRPHEKLRRQLLEFEERISASGQITFGARGNRHDDYAALVVTAALAEQNGLLSMSPSAPRVVRHIPRGFIV